MVDTKQREELDELLCVIRTYLDNSSDRGLTKFRHELQDIDRSLFRHPFTLAYDAIRNTTEALDKEGVRRISCPFCHDYDFDCDKCVATFECHRFQETRDELDPDYIKGMKLRLKYIVQFINRLRKENDEI